MLLRLLILFFLSISLWSFSQSNNTISQLDSIQRLRQLSSDNSIALKERLKYAKTSVDLAVKTKQDSTILLSNRNKLCQFKPSDEAKRFRSFSLYL